MNKKLFSLIYGDEIETAPKTKVVPAEDFSILLEASQVFEHIKEDAEKYRHEVATECEQYKEKGFKEGYDEGFKMWAEHLVKLEEEIERVHAETQKIIIPAALKAAKKIVARELELSEDVIVDIVSATLKTVSQHKKVTIYVSKKDLELVEKNRPKLREIFESLEALSIRERDDITPGGCVVETEIGIINAQLEHRWNIMEKAFETMARTATKKINGKKND